jgi:hypothetical protein
MTECPICHEIITDIYELSCKHTYCTVCAQKIDKCAMCRAEIVSNYTDDELQQIYPNNKLDEILELPEVKTLYFNLPITHTINFCFGIDNEFGGRGVSLTFYKYIKLTTELIVNMINSILNSVNNNLFDYCINIDTITHIKNISKNRHFVVVNRADVLFDSKSDKIITNLPEIYYDRDKYVKYSWMVDMYIIFIADNVESK